MQKRLSEAILTKLRDIKIWAVNLNSMNSSEYNELTEKLDEIEELVRREN